MIVKFPGKPSENAENQRLLDELDELLVAGDEQLDVAEVETRLKALQQTAPVMTDYDPQQAWEDLQRQHPLLTETEIQPERHHRGRTALRILIIATACLFTLAVTVSALPGDPLQTMLAWGQGLLSAESSDPEAAHSQQYSDKEHLAMAHMMEADGFLDHACPVWFPREFRLKKNSRTLSENAVSYQAFFEAEEDPSRTILLRAQSFAGSMTEVFPTVGSYEYQLAKLAVRICREGDSYSALWQWNEYLYRLDGALGESELLQILESIQ